MRFADLLRLAVGNLRENPLRTFLCALSVAVGTGALLLIAAIGLMGQEKVSEGLKTLGVSGLTVYLEDHGSGNPLSAELADKMEQVIAEVDSVMPIKAKSGTARAGHASEDVLFLGADERLGEVMQLEVLAGSLLTARQADTAQPVAVVGDALARALFGRNNIVGRSIRLRFDGQEQDFTVCAVVKAQTSALGSFAASFAPQLVYIPYAYLATTQENADQVFVQCVAEADLSAVSEQISRYLTGYGDVDGIVRVQNMSGMVDTVNRLANLGVALFAVVGAITLCVALIGVLCSMLAAAYEKTSEIGVLLALGAQQKDVRRIFLLQSALLCAFGGGCGMAIVQIILYSTISVLLDWKITTGLFLLCISCGVAAGLLPAIRAARLDPIEAMRK